MDLCGCHYEGDYNPLGFFHTPEPLRGSTTTYGEYTFENGSVYTGSFRDGEFSGTGTLEFGGAGSSSERMSIIGTWQHGRLVRGVLKFADGLVFHFDNWKYCDGYDRRYWREITGTLPPSTQLNVTANNAKPTGDGMPAYTLDTGDGYYDPTKREIFRLSNRELLRIADDEEHEFIMRNCLRNWDADSSDEPRNRYLDLPIGLPYHRRDAWKCGSSGKATASVKRNLPANTTDSTDTDKLLQLELGQNPSAAVLQSTVEFQPAWLKLLMPAASPTSSVAEVLSE